MKRSVKTWLVVLAAVLLLGALIGRAVVARKAERAQTTARPAATGLAIDLAPGDVATARTVALTRTLAVSGGLKAVQSAVVRARVAAEVREVTVREGDAVRAGQLLARLDDTEYRFRLRQAEQQAATTRAQFQIANRTLETNRALVEQGFISKNALDTAVSNAAGSDAAVQAAEAAVDLARKALRDTEVRSPIAGVVSVRAVQPGERVAVDARLLEIVDLSRIELEAAVTPEDVPGVPVGAVARLRVDGLAGPPVEARVARINPSTQAGTRAVVVYLAVEPRPGLRQGLFARGAIELERRDVLAVPASAVRVDQARPYVLVVAGGAPDGAGSATVAGRAVLRPVTPGVRGEARFGDGPAAAPEAAVEVAEGVSAGEVVLRGTVGALRDGTPVRLAQTPAATAQGSATLPAAPSDAPAPAAPVLAAPASAAPSAPGTLSASAVPSAPISPPAPGAPSPPIAKPLPAAPPAFAAPSLSPASPTPAVPSPPAAPSAGMP